MGDGFYRSKDPTNSIKVLKEHKEYTKNTKKHSKFTYTYVKHPLVYTNTMGLTRGQLPQRAGSPSLIGGGTAAAVPSPWTRGDNTGYTCVEQSCGVQQGVDDERRVPGGFQTVPRDELCHVPGR